jgi:hypothetical protein
MFIRGVNDTGDNGFSLIDGVVDTADKFFTGIVDTAEQ